MTLRDEDLEIILSVSIFMVIYKGYYLLRKTNI